MASNPCKRRRTDLNGDKKREICAYKDAHPKATCSDIAARFAKEWAGFPRSWKIMDPHGK